MGRRSSIDLLPEDVIADLKQRMLSGKFTIDELTDWLDDGGFEISRSAVGRYSKKVEEIGVHMREAQAMAEALAAEVGPSFKDGQQSRMLTNVLSTIAFRTMTGSLREGDGEAGQMGAQDLHFLARTLKDIASTSKITDDRERTIRDAERTAAAERVETAANEEGWSQDTVTAIRKHVLGTGG